MKITEFKALKVGDVVYACLNTGTAGLFEYQYIGIFKKHNDGKDVHVFLSEYFLSVININVKNTENSRSLAKIFLTKIDASQYQMSLRNSEIEF